MKQDETFESICRKIRCSPRAGSLLQQRPLKCFWCLQMSPYPPKKITVHLLLSLEISFAHVFFPQGCRNKVWVALKQQKFIVSQFWRPEVRNHGVSRAILPLAAVGKDLSLPFLASGVCWQSLVFLGVQMGHFSLCLHGHVAVFSLCFFTWSSHPTRRGMCQFLCG